MAIARHLVLLQRAVAVAVSTSMITQQAITAAPVAVVAGESMAATWRAALALLAKVLPAAMAGEASPTRERGVAVVALARLRRALQLAVSVGQAAAARLLTLEVLAKPLVVGVGAAPVAQADPAAGGMALALEVRRFLSPAPLTLVAVVAVVLARPKQGLPRRQGQVVAGLLWFGTRSDR